VETRPDRDRKENLRRDLKKDYCKGEFKAFAAANISVEQALTTQPHNLQDLSECK